MTRRRLGISQRRSEAFVVSLLGPEATGQAIRDALERGGLHLFHYAGPGYFSERLPEIRSFF
jgi:hypothetical protein